ncbi:hypothetical protein CR513_32717, partial [Mucuna pruriens]
MFGDAHLKEKTKLKDCSGYFIGYAKKSKWYRFYCPTHNARIVESRNAKFLENDLISRNGQFQDIVYEKDHYEVQPFGSSDRMIVIHTPQVQMDVRQLIIEVSQVVENDRVDQVVDEEQQDYVEQQLVEQHSKKKSRIPSDYVVYLQELDYNIEAKNDMEIFSQAMIIIALITHFDFELHQMDVKMMFLNDDIVEEVYIKQLEGFSSNDAEHLMIFCLGLMINELLYEVKQFLSKNFDMKDIEETFYVISIKIHGERSQGILSLSQKAYINKVLESFNMKDCSPSIAPIMKDDKLNMSWCPQNNFK